MKKNAKIAILMSTYNGADYINKQIESLVKQSVWNDCVLYIRDDGSNDSTCEILHKIESEQIRVEFGKNIGFLRSFFWLINNVNDYDYYFFCDQDDVWKHNKIERAVSFLDSECKESNLPLLYYSDRTIIDSEDNIIMEYDKVSKLYPDKFNILTTCHCPGHTIAYNDKLHKLLRNMNPVDGEYHDYLASLIAVYLGKVIYDEWSSLYYRHHDHSVTYSAHKKFRLALSKKFIVFFKKLIRFSLSDFYKSFEDSLGEDDKKMIALFLVRNPCNQIKKFFILKRYRKEFFNDFYFRLLVLFWII